MSIPNTTFRSFIEKLGGTDPSEFIGEEGDLFWNPNTGSLRVSDGSTPGGMAVTGVTTVGNGGPIQQDLIPDGDGVYDLGSSTAKWKDLYLTNNTMYLGSTPVSINGGSLAVDGNTLPTTAEVSEAARNATIATRLIVNTDRKVYSDGDMAVVNPNAGNGGWYHQTFEGSYIRWNFWTPNPNGDDGASASKLGELQSGWCLFTPWTTNTDYPYMQFYTSPQRGGGNAASWYRSRVTYSRAPEAQVVGEPVLLYFGANPSVYPGVPRKEMTKTSSQGPEGADEAVFSSYLASSTGLADNHLVFSTTNVGFNYAGKNYNYGLYAVPDTAAGINTSFTAANGTTFEIKDGLIIGMS